MGDGHHDKGIGVDPLHLHPGRTDRHPRHRQALDIRAFGQKALHRRRWNMALDPIARNAGGVAIGLGGIEAVADLIVDAKARCFEVLFPLAAAFTTG